LDAAAKLVFKIETTEGLIGRRRREKGVEGGMWAAA
jgi:hypothetical protein